MLDPLVFKAVSYGLILLLAFTGLILSLLSLRNEYAADTPLSGLFPLVLIIAGLCGFMWGLTFFLWTLSRRSPHSQIRKNRREFNGMSMQIHPCNIQFVERGEQVMNRPALIIVITLLAKGISQAGDYYIYRDSQGRTWLSNQDPRKQDDSTGKRPKDITIIDRYQWQDGPSGQLADSQPEAPAPVKKMTK